MRDCRYRHLSVQTTFLLEEIADLNCALSRAKGQPIFYINCDNCDIDKVMLDCGHMAPVVQIMYGERWPDGYGAKTLTKCNQFNQFLDESKSLCKECKAKKPITPVSSLEWSGYTPEVSQPSRMQLTEQDSVAP